jgi:hypothetical protein
MDSPLLTDLEDFAAGHRAHGELFADASPPGPNGYRLEVRCHCGGVFTRWVTPDDSAVELACWRGGTDE